VGPDDYITKPFDSRILAARHQRHPEALGPRGAGGGREGVLSIGALQIDNAARRVKIADVEISLTMTEFHLLAVLAATRARAHAGPVPGQGVGGNPHDLRRPLVDPHVQRLRRKLSDHTNTGVSLELCRAWVTVCRSNPFISAVRFN